jgi:hypothetical protein
MVMKFWIFEQSKKNLNNARYEKLYLLVLPVYFLVLYAPVVLFGEIPAPVDLALYHEPWASARPNGWRGGSYVLSDIMDALFPALRMVYDSIWAGDLPFYTDKVQNGVPWLMVARHEILSPLLLLPVLIFGPETGFSIAIILKFILGSSFFIFLARVWGLSLYASTLGSLVFIANAIPVQTLGNGLGGMYFLLPVAMYGIHKTLEGRWLWTFLTPITLMTIFLCGYPPAVAFHGTLYSFYIIYRLIMLKTCRISALLHLLFLGVATLLLVFPVLMETYQYLMKDFDFSYRTNYWARRLPQASIGTLLIPWGFEGTEAGLTWVRHAIYIGVLPLLIALISVFLPNKQREYYFFAVFLIYLLFVLFNLYFLSHVYRYIPVLNGTYPNNQKMIFGYVMAVIVAFGIEQLKSALECKKRVLLSLIFAFAVLGFIVGNSFSVFAIAQPKHIFLSIVALFITVVLVLWWSWSNNKWIVQGLILFSVMVDLSIMGYGFNRTVPRELTYPLTPGVKFINENVGDGKIFSLESSMLADTPLWYSIRTVGGRGFFTMETKNLYRLINSNAFEQTPTQYLFPANHTTTLNSQILDIMGVRYITANDSFSKGENRQWIEGQKDRNGAPKFKLVHSGDMAIFENLSAKGKAYLVSNISIDRNNIIYENLQDNSHDLNDFAWVDEDSIEEIDRDILISNNNTPLSWKIVDHKIKNSSQAYTVYCSRDALLVVGDNFHKSWRVTVNGANKALIKTNFALRGVVLSAGENKVTFAYRPNYLFWGVPIMIATFGLLFLMVFIIGFNNFRAMLKTSVKN